MVKQGIPEDSQEILAGSLGSMTAYGFCQENRPPAVLILDPINQFVIPALATPEADITEDAGELLAWGLDQAQVDAEVKNDVVFYFSEGLTTFEAIVQSPSTGDLIPEAERKLQLAFFEGVVRGIEMCLKTSSEAPETRPP
jgi:hypothetical protein